MSCTNAKFAITSKSGRSVVMEFKNYKDAQKYADQHYGKGTIVQLIGNSRITSINSIVRNALASNMADRRTRDVDDVTVSITCDKYDNNLNVKNNAIHETCQLHSGFLREFLGHCGLGAQVATIIRQLEQGEAYATNFPLTYHISITRK